MGELKSIISVKKLSFSYGQNAILHDINLEIHSSAFTVILGQNGSGKSTLLRLMAGLLKPEKEKVFISEVDISYLNLKSKAKMLGFLGQKHKAVFPFTVEEVVMTGRAAHIRITPGKQDYLIVSEVLEKAGIFHLKDSYYTELSGGEQQLVMIARVLAQQAKVLLLDEPTTHLDFCNQERVLSLIKNLTNDGLTVVAVLHDPNHAFLYGDNFVFLKNGKIVHPSENSLPWDASFLENIYETKVNAIPYDGKALIIPSKSRS